MPDERKEQVKRFINDAAMSRAVHTVLQNIFLRSPKNKDVQSLAAAWMAKENFNDAWKEIQTFKGETVDKKEPSQIGL